MRIVLVSFHTSPLETPGTRDAGGLNVSLLNLALALGRRGHQVTIVTRRTDNALAQTVTISPNVCVEHLSAGPERPESLDETAAWVSEFAEHLRDFLRSIAPVDVVHSHYWLSAVASQIALQVAREGEPVHVMNLHTLGEEKRALTGDDSERMNERVAAEHSLLTNPRITPVTSSHAEAEALRTLYGVEAHRIAVLQPGVDTTLFAPIAGGSVRSDIRLVVVARIQAYKGQDFAVDVFEQLRNLVQSAHPNSPLHGVRCSLRIVGSATTHPADAAFLAALKRRITASGLDHAVQFVSHTSRGEIARELGEATLTLIPSLSETFGLVALESAAAGTPVIVQAVGGLCESVSDGVSGILMHNRDALHWAETIMSLLSDLERYSSLRASARTFALTHTWERMALDAESLYTRLMHAQQ